jgi:hypothetical protein
VDDPGDGVEVAGAQNVAARSRRVTFLLVVIRPEVIWQENESPSV